MNGVRIQKTGAPDVIAASDGSLTLSVPIQIKRRSGRKLVTLPNGDSTQPRPWDVAATPMQLALARGYRWLAMLESSEAKSISELAAREKIDNSYMCRMLNLTTLAPDIVAAILDESLPPHVTVHELAISPPVLWEEQRARIGVVGDGRQRSDRGRTQVYAMWPPYATQSGDSESSTERSSIDGAYGPIPPR